MENQKQIDAHCFLCNKDRIFVTTLSPIGEIVCCCCGYKKSLTPFKMVQDQFGYRIIKEEIKNDR